MFVLVVASMSMGFLTPCRRSLMLITHGCHYILLPLKPWWSTEKMCFCLLDLWHTHTPTHNCATFMCGSMCTCTCVWVPLCIFHEVQGRSRDNLKCWYSPSTWFENLCLCYLLMWLESSWSLGSRDCLSAHSKLLWEQWDCRHTLCVLVFT